MPVPSAIADLSTTPGSNSPVGADSPSVLDDHIRTLGAFIRQLSDAKLDASSGVALTGDQTIAGTKTFSSPIAGSVTGTAANVTGTVAIAKGGTGAATAGAALLALLNGSQLAGLRNKLINGNFQVNQRAYVSGSATSGANQYTLDRWRVVTSGQNLTFSASGNGNQITAPAGGVEQVIEGINIEGGTYVLNWTGTATATVNGTARTKGETFTLTANTNATVRFTSGTVSLVQLEFGTVVTPFEQRHISIETILCQRYYEAFSTVGFSYAGGAGAGWNILSTPFKVTKRATPTIAYVSFSYSNASAITNGTVSTELVNATVTAAAIGALSATGTITATAEL